MSAGDQRRLERLYPGLSVDQRITAFIEALHRTGSPHLALTRTVPDAEAGRFSYQLGLLRAAHCDLAWIVMHLKALTVTLQLRLALLLTFRRWALQAEQVAPHPLHRPPVGRGRPSGAGTAGDTREAGRPRRGRGPSR